MGEDEAAVEAARNAIAGNPRYSSPRFLLAAASAQLGKEAEARAALADYLRLAPEQATIPKLLPVVDLSDHPTYQRQLQRLVEGLRKPGLPE